MNIQRTIFMRPSFSAPVRKERMCLLFLPRLWPPRGPPATRQLPLKCLKMAICFQSMSRERRHSLSCQNRRVVEITCLTSVRISRFQSLALNKLFIFSWTRHGRWAQLLCDTAAPYLDEFQSTCAQLIPPRRTLTCSQSVSALEMRDCAHCLCPFKLVFSKRTCAAVYLWLLSNFNSCSFANSKTHFSASALKALHSGQRK